MNSVTIMGRLGADPEVKEFQGGSVTNFNVATNEKWTDKQGQKQERTEWHKCEAWGKTGEFIAKFFQKGNMIACEGSLKTDEWDDKDGNKRKTTKIKVHRAHFTGEASEAGGGGNRQPKQKPAEDPFAFDQPYDDSDIPF